MLQIFILIVAVVARSGTSRQQHAFSRTRGRGSLGTVHSGASETSTIHVLVMSRMWLAECVVRSGMRSLQSGVLRADDSYEPS
jgi:hypothetical protein